MNTIDCRNMACPAPVITVKRTLEELGEVRVLLDDGAPRENVTRFAVNRGFNVSEEQCDAAWALSITHGVSAAVKPTASVESAETVFLITSDRLGDGPDELGRLLMKNFIHTLLETGNLPSRLLFMNSGVHLTTEGSAVLEALGKLAGMGVEILSCGLCLDFFGKKDKLLSGGTTNMLTTVETTLSNVRVIRL
ncbi:MAG: sulfurtransferase-like selenium metabolism protein YedF [Deltaproteobacteria bacterium]|nr:sulfurtransferase-like selenium metabolism protein YedF [Deltaproteobacteria bacterium]